MGVISDHPPSLDQDIPAVTDPRHQVARRLEAVLLVEPHAGVVEIIPACQHVDDAIVYAELDPVRLSEVLDPGIVMHVWAIELDPRVEPHAAQLIHQVSLNKELQHHQYLKRHQEIVHILKYHH